MSRLMTSCRLGRAGIAPDLVHASAPAAQAILRARSAPAAVPSACCLSMATAAKKPAVNASPAPVVSTTCTGKEGEEPLPTPFMW